MIGIDIVFIPRFSSLLKNGITKSIESKIFTLSELEQLNTLDEVLRMKNLAGRFAAKEAVIKASMGELKITDLNRIEIVNHDGIYMQAVVTKGLDDFVKYIVSFSDDGDYAIGMAIAEDLLDKPTRKGE